MVYWIYHINILYTADVDGGNELDARKTHDNLNQSSQYTLTYVYNICYRGIYTLYIYVYLYIFGYLHMYTIYYTVNIYI